MNAPTGTPIDGVEGNKEESRNPDAAPDDSKEQQASQTAAPRRRHGKPSFVKKEWYSKKEAARYLGVAEITITRYLEKGILHSQRLPTPGGRLRSSRYDYGRLRIHKSELDRYLESVDRTPNEPMPQGSAGDATQVVATQYDISREAGGSDISTPDIGGEFMTRQEAALRLGVSSRTIDRYVINQVLRLAGYFRCPDSYTRAHVFRSDVERLLQQ